MVTVVARDRKEAGFTLLEILIAVSLLALLSGLTLAGFRFEIKAWRNAASQTDVSETMVAVRRVLERTISQAYPTFATADPSDRRIAFDGAPETLVFVAPLPDMIEHGIVGQQRLFLAGSAEHFVLSLGWRLDLPAAERNTILPETILPLLTDVKSIRFAYFGADKAGDPPGWLDHWSAKTTLPLLVRIRIIPSSPLIGSWPDQFVHLRTTTNTACAYDPADIVCRRIQ